MIAAPAAPSLTARAPAPQRRETPLLPLENGDRLSRAEFERRYAAMPHVKKAELIEGIVYMASPVRVDYHGEPHAELVMWLGRYKIATPGLGVADNTTIRLDPDNEPQPDILLRIRPAAQGQARQSPDGYVEGAPEFVAEISASSASIDMRDKKRVYRRNGVREYLIWLVAEQRVVWHVLADGEYLELQPAEDGLMKSRIFPGLWLDVAALLEDRSADVAAALDRGIASPEHAAFVAALAARLNAK